MYMKDISNFKIYIVAITKAANEHRFWLCIDWNEEMELKIAIHCYK